MTDQPGGAPGLTGLQRAVRGALVTALVAIALAGSIRPDLLARPLHAVGLQQSWDVFAPDPAHRDVELWAEIEWTDGTVSTWRPPRSPAATAARSHRWERWADHLVDDRFDADRDRAAAWIAGAVAVDGGPLPRQVRLVRRWSDLPPPGTDPTSRRWHEFAFHVWVPEP